MSVRFMGLCSALAIIAAAFVTDVAEARGSRRNVAGYERVSLTTIRDNPSAFIGKRVSFDCFYAGLGKIYQPFQTPFVPEQFLNLHVWEVGTKLWDNRERRKAFLFCFIPRDLEKLVDYVIRLETYETVRFFGRVTVVYSGHPWFEIEDIESSEIPSFTDNALKHILVGIKSLRNEDFTMAGESFREALRIEGGLPEGARTFVQRELGRAYYELEKFAEAADALQEAARITKGDAWILLRWGQSLSRASDALSGGLKAAKLKQAQHHLEAARRLEPANPEVHAEIGWVVAKLGDPLEGILHCKRAIALKQTADSYRILGKIYLEINKYADAENAYQRAIMLDPSNPKFHRELAFIYMRQEKYREAEAEFTNVVTLTSTETQGHVERAEARRRRGDSDGAKEDFESARRINSECLDALLGLAAVYRDDGKYKEAAKFLDEADILKPGSVSVLVAKGEVLLAQEQYARAADAFGQILVKQRKPPLADVRYGLGLALLMKEKPELGRAAAELSKAISEAPKHLGALKTIAQVYSDMGKFRLAVQNLEKAKDLAPSDERIRLRLAMALAEDRQIDNAVNELTLLLSIRPKSAYANNLKAFYLIEFLEGRVDEASELATAAYESNPASGTFQDTLGWAKFKAGDIDGARVLLDQAVLSPKDPYPFYHLAELTKDDEPDVARINIEAAKKLLDKVTGRGHVSTTMRNKINALARQLGVR